MIFDAETDVVEDSSDVNYDSDTDMQAAGTSRKLRVSGLRGTAEL